MSTRTRLPRGLAALLATLPIALAVVSPAAAADLAEAPAFALKPAELLAAAEAERPDEADEGFVLLNETHFTLDAEGRIRYLRRRVYQPLTQRFARLWNDTAMNWDPWHQERPEIRARVVTADGTEHWLDPETLTDVSLEASEPDTYQDRHQVGGPLPAVAPGCVVEEVIEVVDREPLFAAGTVRRQFVALSVPVVHSRVVLNAPESLPLHWKTGLLPGVEPEVQRSDGRVRTVFDLHSVAADEADPPGLPPEVPRFAYVGFATGASWNAVASAYSEIVDSRIGSFQPGGPPTVPETAGREERIAAAVAWMHARVRYTGLELGEAAIVPRTPDEVLARRYGDCKDKATLLVALLRHLGVPARVALLDADTGQDVDPELPGLTGLGGFNHAIVFIPGEPALWIDATDPFSPIGELPPDDQGRLALVASPETVELTRTPRSGSATNRIVVDHEIELAELGKARQVDTEVYRGASARELRTVWDVAGDQVREAAEELGGFEVEGMDDFAQPVRLRMEQDEVDHAATDQDQAVVAISAAPLLERLPEELRDPDGEPRDQPYQVVEPFSVESSFHIVPPPGFALRDLPEGEVRAIGCATYQSELKRRGEEVWARLRFELSRDRLTAEEFEELRTAAAALAEESATLIWFDQVGAVHLHAGRIREALIEYRRLADLHPSEALHQVQLANALLAGGLGAEAREAARRATEIEPDSVLAHFTLGLTLSSDLVGRRLAAGFDRDGARAAFERAAELDPDDLDAQVQLALVLEHAPDGTRYGPGSDLDRAIEVYRAVRNRLRGTGFEDNLIYALLEAERYDELAEELGEQPETAQRKTLLTIAESMTDGPEQAIRKASERARSDQSQLRETLVAAGQDRLARRYYSQAAELIAAGARSAPNAAELLKLAETARHTRRHEELRPDTGTPEGAVRAMILAVAGAEPDADAFTSFLAPSVRPAIEELLQAEEGRTPLTETLRQSVDTVSGAASPDLAFDLSLAAPYDLSGDDQAGYRVRLVPPGPQVPDGFHAYVVATGDGYRVAAFSSAPAMLGLEALARVEAGDVEGARHWLDWATELVAPPAVGNDPLSGGPLDLLWTRGSPAEVGDVRIAAAALAFAGGLSEDARKLLSTELETSVGRRRQGVALALAYGYQLSERWEEELAVADLLAAEVPRSRMAFLLGTSALYGLERFAELSERAQSRTSHYPDDVMAQRAAAEAQWRTGDLDAARAAYQHIESEGRAESADYNQLAWLSLFSDPLDESALRWAQRAAELDGYVESASLHTLAAAYADSGRPADAYRVVLQAIEARSEPEPEPHDWYVFGRLAEIYGLPEAAADYFRRVETPEDERPGSTWRLAQRRLRALEAAREAPAPPKR